MSVVSRSVRNDATKTINVEGWKEDDWFNYIIINYKEIFEIGQDKRKEKKRNKGSFVKKYTVKKNIYTPYEMNGIIVKKMNDTTFNVSYYNYCNSIFVYNENVISSADSKTIFDEYVKNENYQHNFGYIRFLYENPIFKNCNIFSNGTYNISNAYDFYKNYKVMDTYYMDNMAGYINIDLYKSDDYNNEYDEEDNEINRLRACDMLLNNQKYRRNYFHTTVWNEINRLIDLMLKQKKGVKGGKKTKNKKPHKPRKTRKQVLPPKK